MRAFELITRQMSLSHKPSNGAPVSTSSGFIVVHGVLNASKIIEYMGISCA